MSCKSLCLLGSWFVGFSSFAVEPAFRASFEGTTDAVCRGKSVRAARTEGVEYVPGPVGRAVKFSSRNKSAVGYAVRQIVGLKEGAVAFWMRTDFAKGRQTGADVFRTTPFDASVPWSKSLKGIPTCPSATGSGAVRVWMSTAASWLRGECYDDKLTHTGQMIPNGVWHHYTFVWDEVSLTMYVDGRGGVWSDAASPMREAIERANPNSRTFVKHTYSKPVAAEGFVLGAPADGQEKWGFDGAIDELAVFDRHLSADEVAAFAAASGVKAEKPVDWTAKFAGKPNPYVGEAGAKLDLELVEEVRLDSAEKVAALTAANRFGVCGELSFRKLNGITYAEVGARPGDRLALRFPGGKTSDPLSFFEIEYPDDGFRTCDMLIQGTQGGGEYSMQVGYACGHEYANSGKMQVFRTPYWMPSNGTDDLTLVATTAREGQNAAIAAVRRYRVKNGRLPPVAFNLPPKKNGWNRSFALYYEDPSIGYDFGAKDDGFSEEGLLKTADACIATMKYAGQDLLAYPGVWYQGLIDANAYNPRNHAPNFLDGFYARFDAAGLGVMPTLNPNSMPVPEGLVTLETMTNGTLHSSPIAITATGKPNWGGWHNSPPNFNIAHPDVQKKILEWIDALIAQGVRHPSFRGVCLHLTRHCFLSWGVADGGYNDYAIDAFERFAQMKVPVDRKDPLRGKAYATWLKTNAWDEWCAYRQSVIEKLYAEIAARLRKARPDLRLWVNSFNMGLQTDYAYLENRATEWALRDMGVRGCEIANAADRRVGGSADVIVAQTFLPCKPRWATRSYKDGDPVYEKMKRIHLEADTFSALQWVNFPWIGQHDIYWESACERRGREGKLKDASWFNECGWRVVTINPSGRNPLEAFAAPLRHYDALGLTKGGFLIGTYGMEDVIRPFIQAFKALPAVKFDTLVSDDVTVRQKAFDGRTWFYAVNTTGTRREVRLELPAEATDLVTGDILKKGVRTLSLDAWELKSYVLPSGNVACVQEPVKSSIVAFKDAAKAKGWDAWDAHKRATAWREKPCINWERLVRLEPDLRYLGRVQPKKPSEITDSDWTVGCETLDRDYGDWDKYKGLLAELGAKRGRLFSGWAKTEQTKGACDFSWLDPQVREMAAMGMKPWICISYGNPVWGSDFRLGMRVSQIVNDKAAFAAWIRYVKALVARYQDVVTDWEVWNEPFGQSEEYATLFYETAKAVREVQPQSRVICTAVSFPKDYTCVLEKLKKEKAFGLASLFSYHPYSANPDESYAVGEGQFVWQPALALRKLVKSYSPAFDVLQGESGCPSQLEYAHALPNIPWTEISQAKWNLRRAMGDAAYGIPSACFTFIDLQYTFMLQSFGLVRSNALKECVYRRPSYRGMQHVYALFDKTVKPLGMKRVKIGLKDLSVASFERAGRRFSVVWFSGRRPSDELAYETVDLSAVGVVLKERTWTDLLTGRICALTDLHAVPVWDSPVVLR